MSMEKVVIVGAGLGGVLLGILLERASIDYVILESMPVAKMPLEGGGVIFMTPQIQPLLRQLGLLDQLKQLAKPVNRITVLAIEQGRGMQPEVLGEIESGFLCSRFGYDALAISRPELYNSLISHIPPSKLHLGKQVADVSFRHFQEHDEDISKAAACVCTDGSTYEGIIIGADGAYSSVRRSLYRQLKDRNMLTAQDREPMRFASQALVGMTRPLDPERFAWLRKEHSEVRVLVSDGGGHAFTLWCVPMTENRLCWMLDEPLAEYHDCPEVEDWSFMVQTITDTCNRHRMMQSPLEGTLLGELFEWTPEGTMLSIPREEGFFSRWTYGKIALMGDACHKALPYGGQPFAQAGYDAVKLANALYAHAHAHRLGQGTQTQAGTQVLNWFQQGINDGMAARLRSYETERRAKARAAVAGSHRLGELLSRQDWIGKVVRYIVLGYVPQFLLHWIIAGRFNRDLFPQAAFLPKVI